MTGTAWQEHLGALFTVIVACTTVIGTGWIACATAVSLRRLVRSQKDAGIGRRDSAETRESEAEQEEEVGKGGARRLRKVLVVCLMSSDGLIALSAIGPATMGLTGVAIAGEGCDPAGLILAMGLWWQYGFSLVIAITTYIALRHPLSRIKRMAEKGPGWMIALILSAGAAQAILWRYLHGYFQWRDYCFYGPPSSKSAELFQFIPRLLSSLVITTIYIPLIHFLRRPDLSALYLSPRPASFASARSSHDIPPWERLSFPKFAGLGMTGLDTPPGSDTNLLSASRSRSSVSLASPFYPVAVPLSVPVKPSAAYLGETKYVAPHSDRMDRGQGSTMSGSTLVPSLRVHIIGTGGEIERKGSFSHASTRSGRSARSGMTGRSSIRKSLIMRSRTPSPSPHRIDPPPLVCVCDLDADVQPSIYNEESGPTSPASLHPSVHRDRDTDTRDDASFRGMLDYVPCQLHPWEGGPLRGERPSTPTKESMASFMNRRTSCLLIWFPFTHLVICALTLVRYIYFNVAKLDGKTIEALSVVSLLGQGVADVIVFGKPDSVTSRGAGHRLQPDGRTQQRYRAEVALCTPARNREEPDRIAHFQQY